MQNRRALYRSRFLRTRSALGHAAVTIATSACFLFFLDRGIEAVDGSKHPSSLSFAAGFSLWGGHAAVQVAATILFAGILVASVAIERFSKKRIDTGLAAAGLFGGVAGLPFFIAGRALSSGDWISRQSYASAIAPVAAIFGAGVFFLLGLLHRSKRRWIYTTACALTAFASLSADVFVYPGIYPAFHHLAYGVSAATAFLLWESLTECLKHRLTPLFQTVLCITAAALIAVGLVSFGSLKQKNRAELLLKSRTASYLLSISAGDKNPGRLYTVLERIADGRPIAFNTPEYSASQLVIPKDWNIVLIIVDAMRADTLLPNRRPKQAHAKNGDTPFIDRWISDSYQFQFTYSPSNMTEKSMPSIFSGLSPKSLRKKSGTPLSVQLSKLGRTPVAVVNKLFSSKQKLISLFSGYSSVSYYSDKNQRDAVQTMLNATDKLGANPFFAWFHFYCLHNPYYAEGGIQKDTDGPFRERYRRALRWLDKELNRLFSGFEKQGLTSKTVFILTADHGEGLGDRRLMTHGSFIFDEETRVPFYVHIPGRQGGLIPSTVGLIDLVPTLTDLLGYPSNRADGVSLAPLMVNPKATWNRDYYLENSLNNYLGVVQGRDKLIYFQDTDTLFRFDLKTDLQEKENLFNPKAELDQLLLSRLVYDRADLFAEELKSSKTRALFEHLYRKIGALKPDAARLLQRIAREKKP